MAYITYPELEDLDKEVRESLERARQKMGNISEIQMILSLRPDIFHATSVIFRTLMLHETELDKSIKETIAILVSDANGCDVCVGEHERLARMMGLPLQRIEEALTGLDSMNIPGNERVLYRFCLKCAGKENYKILTEDVDEVRSAGFTDSQILEAVAIVGYFNYINTLSNSLGAGKGTR